MTFGIIPALLLLLQPQQGLPTAGLTGVVRRVGDNKAIEDVNVTAICGGKGFTTQSDADGSFQFPELPIGACSVRIERSGISRVRQIVLPQRDPKSALELWLPAPGSIGGRVLDRNSRPVGAGQVWLLERTMILGVTRYRVRGSAQIEQSGAFRLDQVEPNRSHLLLAAPELAKLPDAIEPDPAQHAKLLAPTFYPDSRSPAGAQTVRLRPGEILEGMDIRMEPVASLCVSGRIDAPAPGAPVDYRLIDQGMPVGGIGFMIARPGKTADNGEFRICGLPPGDYTLAAYQVNVNAKGFYGTGEVKVGDKDVQEVRVAASETLPLSASIVWDDKGRDGAAPEFSVKMVPLKGFSVAGIDGDLTQACAPTCRVQWGGLRLDDYRVYISGLDGLAFVKDVIYGGASVLHQPLKFGGAIAGTELKVVLGAKGGRLSVRVSDRDGRPLPDMTILIASQRASSASAFADGLVEGVTDENGVYVSPALAPGAFMVLASTEPADRSEEGIVTLMGELEKGERVELAPGQIGEIALKVH